jgi:hypothetical protein
MSVKRSSLQTPWPTSPSVQATWPPEMVGGGVGGGGHWVNLRAEKRKGQRENDKEGPI